jgi:hypothetical protein
MNDYRGIPTRVLQRMWENEKVRLASLRTNEPSCYYRLLAMRKELDRRKDEPKPVVDVNFSKEYLTD